MISSVLPVIARRWLRRALAGALLPLLALPATAVTYIQTVNHNGSGDWHMLAHWNTASNGSGTSPASINANDHFVASRNGWVLRSPTGTSTFGGGSLTLGGTQVLAIRSANSASMTTVPNLITRGTPFLRAGYGISNLTVENLNAQSGTLEIDGHTSTTPTFGVTIHVLQGKGDIKTTGTPGGTNRLSLLDATSYQGTITVESGKVRFATPVSSAGAFVAPAPADVTFDHDAVFTGLTVGGNVYSPGTYNANALGFGGSPAASVTVRTPATWYLTTNQTGGHNWTQAFASQWKADANGSGASAPSINVLDTYIHNVGTNALRTPATSSVFLGGSLNLGGSARLVLAGGSSAISTVPALVATGGIIVGGGAARNLAVDTLTASSGTATFSTTTGGVINLFVGELLGPGNLAISGAGKLVPSIDQGGDYTGTITVNTGATLHVLTGFDIGGRLVVNSGGNVILDDDAYVTALTVAGVSRPAGIYTAANLGSGFSGSGQIVVSPPDGSVPSPATEVIVDNLDANFTSGWKVSTGYPSQGFHGTNYLHDGGTVKGQETIQFVPDLGAGSYEVFLRWTSDNNRSDAVPVTVVHAGGTNPLITVNQKTGGGGWVSIGTFTFAQGTGGSVTISNAGTVGYVIADAVKFTPSTTPPPPPPPPAFLFYENFTPGTPRLLTTWGSPTPYEVAHAPALNGRALRFDWVSGAERFNGAFVNVSQTPQKVLHVRIRLMQQANANNNGIQKIIRFRASINGQHEVAAGTFNFQSGKLLFYGDDFGNGWNHEQFPSTVATHGPNTFRGQYRYLEARVDYTTPGVQKARAWVDGTLVLDTSIPLSSTMHPSTAFDVLHILGTYNHPADNRSDWVDDITVSTDYIGLP